MKVLVLFSHTECVTRKTIKDHLYCFQKYIKDVQFHYCNVLTGLPSYLNLVKYDGIILHYTLLSWRWTPWFWKHYSKRLTRLKNKQAIKVALPQDEYAETESLCRLFKSIGVDTVFTCAYPIDYQTLYPEEKTGLKHYITTYTGFVDEETLELIAHLSKQISHRDIDVGYRARSLPYWLGQFGQYKGNIATAFNRLKSQTPLKMDISTDPKDFFYENDWWNFMLRCRIMPGCLGGASLFDAEGTIRQKVEAYTLELPQASFEEVAQKCFPEQDHTLHLFALSPRHFECAMTKTCQVLVEGDWPIFEAGRDYIELKKDFSNLEKVLKQLEDKEFCQQIAENAYEKVVASGKYTYRNFARNVVEHIREASQPSGLKTRTWINDLCFKIVGYFLYLRKKWEKVHLFIFRTWRFCLFRLNKKISAK